ncbi:dipeptide epimerase [Romboutsia weinsteinii]|uniref:Dipeptide epimerase n=1 Tax=Romboutsia weinsteinii TaxID=2020949 RepID=A0A371J5D1_9FIRM|nr:dipeptide epimerase [Romboutsia weinsteinii]RDY27888.1 dipeptide epimerase [Romboutsia weinsteinii]
MKITNIKFEKLKFKLKKPVVVAFATIDSAETIIVKIETDEGIYGFGEASPFGPVTGETLDTVAVVLDMFKKNLVGMNPLKIEKIHYKMNNIILGNSSAKASIDIAVHDILGKVMNQPLYKVLGGYSNKIQTDITIGIDRPEIMAKEAVAHVKNGFNILKLKAGKNAKDDILATKLIREAVGENIRLRMDANQGWDVNTSINTLYELEKYNMEAVEQCLPYWDIDGSAQIKKRSNIKIMLDESIHTPVDAMNAIKKDAADILNIKLMKSSGIYPAVQINSIAQASGVTCMLGCMLETKVGITASASLIAAKKNIIEADVDSFMMIEEDERIMGGFKMEKDTITLSEKPGLGIELNM